MKLSTFSLTVASLVSCATAASPEQHVFNTPEGADGMGPDASQIAWTNSFKQLEDRLDALSNGAQALLENMFSKFPDSVYKDAFLPAPKTHRRKHDSEWDYVVRGKEIQNLWVQNSHGESQRKIDGKLANYDMRIKSVDPTALGVDNVKQYSGYLDDNEEDKHLFYCTISGF